MITVITGPPCSGKTTYVRDNATPGDPVIDFDAIARGLGSPVHYDHDPVIREIAAGAWAGAVRAALRHHRQHHIWIIDSRPLLPRKQQYALAGARIVNLSADRAELHRRADADAEAVEYRHKRIDDFLAGGHPRAQPSTHW